MFFTVKVTSAGTPGTVAAGTLTAVTVRSAEGRASISSGVNVPPVSLAVRPPSYTAPLALVTTSTFQAPVAPPGSEKLARPV